jgi:peptide/nickel transport system substrate-binding protein
VGGAVAPGLAFSAWQSTCPIIDVPYTESQYWKGELPEPLPYDPGLAKNLLEEAGWHDVNGDGIRERAGEEFTFSAMVQMRWEAAAVYVQDNFRKVGIKMEITTLDGGVLYNRINEGDFEAAISGVVNDLFSSKGLLYFCGEDSPLGFYKPQIIKRLDTIKNTMKRDEIDAVFRELRPIFQAELPWTFLTFDVETYVTHRRI